VNCIDNGFPLQFSQAKSYSKASQPESPSQRFWEMMVDQFLNQTRSSIPFGRCISRLYPVQVNDITEPTSGYHPLQAKIIFQLNVDPLTFQ
jgi:hypothetical protein